MVGLSERGAKPCARAAEAIFSAFSPVTTAPFTVRGREANSSSKFSPLSAPPRMRTVSPVMLSAAETVEKTLVALLSLNTFTPPTEPHSSRLYSGRRKDASAEDMA